MKTKGQVSTTLIVAAVICLVIGAGIAWVAKPSPPAVYTDPYTGKTFATATELAAHINATYRPAFTLPGAGIKIDYFTHGIPGDPFWAVVKRGAEDAGALLGVDVKFWFGEKGDLPKHVAMLEEIVAAKPHAIVLAPYYPVMNDTIVRAKAAGIRVFGDADPRAAEWTEAYVSYALDLRAQGKFVAQHVRALVPDGAHVVIPMEVAGAFYAEERSAGFMEGLAGKGCTFEKLDAGYETAITESRINAYLLGHPETKVIFNVGGLTTERAGVVVETLGKSPGEIIVCGNDLLPETATAIKKGYNQGVFYGQQYLVGFDHVVMIYQVIKWDFAPYTIKVGALMIDQTNIDGALKYVEEGVY